MPTSILTGSRYPASSAAPNVPQDLQNAVNDLEDNTVPAFASVSARDTAYTNWTSAGNSMRDGLVCSVAGRPQIYRSGSWHGIGTIIYSTTTIDGSSYTVSQTVMTLSIPDPGYPYIIEMSGSALLHQLGATTGVRAQLVVNGTALNPWGPEQYNSSGSTVTDQSIVYTTSPAVSGTLTGASTATFYVLKTQGPVGNGFQCQTGGAYSILTAKVIPA